MGTEFANKHIGCTIHNCEHHCCCEDYCSLDKIEVGTHEADRAAAEYPLNKRSAVSLTDLPPDIFAMISVINRFHGSLT